MDIYSIVLGVHVASGFSALFGGLIPMLAKKGSKLHVRGGWFYFWAMFGVLVTTIVMFCFKPDRLLFLLLIGIFSFYNVFSGVRKVRFKKKNARAAVLDWSVASIVILSSFLMLAKSMQLLFLASYGMAILYGVFGLVCFGVSFQDLKDFRSMKLGKGMRDTWMILHIGGMGAGYIATITAFLVVNNSVLPPLVVWIGPGVIGGIILSRISKRYRKSPRKISNTAI